MSYIELQPLLMNPRTLEPLKDDIDTLLGRLEKILHSLWCPVFAIVTRVGVGHVHEVTVEPVNVGLDEPDTERKAFMALGAAFPLPRVCRDSSPLVLDESSCGSRCGDEAECSKKKGLHLPAVR